MANKVITRNQVQALLQKMRDWGTLDGPVWISVEQQNELAKQWNDVWNRWMRVHFRIRN